MCNDCPCSCCSCCPCTTVCLFALLGLSASGTWHRDRLRFIRERASGYYHTLPFFCSKYVYDIVLLRLVPCAVFVLCSYDLIGYEHQYNSTYVNDDVNDDVNDECLLVLLVLSSPDQMLHIHARNTMGVCIYTSNAVFICLYAMVELTLPINYRSIHAVFQCSNLPGTWNRPRFSTNPGAKARLCTPTFATPTPTGTPPATTTTVSLAVPKPCWSCCCPWW